MPLFIFLALACLHPAVSSAMGLVIGMAYGLLFSHPRPDFNRKWLHRFLSTSIIGLGFGMNLGVLAQVGLQGVGYTLSGILFTMGLGLFLGRLLGTSKDLSFLICSGTAICGGSAIAAVASVLRSKPSDVSTALVIVFLLNSVALFVFPPLGHLLSLSETQFGLWSAIAIHDTSSVVGASLRYGPHALAVGTMVKLARALWIVPLAFSVGALAHSKDSTSGRMAFKKPWFILGFLIAAALVTAVPALREPGEWIASGAKRLFVVTLFLIGSGFNRQSFAAFNPRPFVQATVLWVIVASASLALIYSGTLAPEF